ncbi:MAG: RimK family alpha-L-glutamate ligase [Acidobacteriota bacterium]
MSVLGVVTARPDLDAYRDLARAAEEAGHRLEVLDATALIARAHPPRVLRGESPVDAGVLGAVLPRIGNWRPDSALAVLAALRAAGVPSVNEPRAIRRGRDHWRTASALAAAGVPHPETVAGSEPEALAAAAGAVCGFPCVVKQRRSRQGVGVIRCADMPSLEAVLDSMWRLGDEVVVQRFCPPGGVSRRVLVLDGVVLGATEHRAGPGEFRANAARGATVRACDLEDGHAGLAVAAAAVTGLDFAGVDLLPDGDRWVVGEVNPTPGWRHFAAATGIAVERELVGALAARAAGR